MFTALTAGRVDGLSALAGRAGPVRHCPSRLGHSTTIASPSEEILRLLSPLRDDRKARLANRLQLGWISSPMLAAAGKPSAAGSSPSRPLPLESGEFMHSREFLRRYERMPQVKKAELIEGVVYVGSPAIARDTAKVLAALTDQAGH